MKMIFRRKINQPRLTFAVIGDWGRQGSPSQRQVARQMGIACERDKAAFVVSVGDNFYERGVTSLDDSHWQQSFETVYEAASLQVPWYVTLGNHDYAGFANHSLNMATPTLDGLFQPGITRRSIK
jgi:tartrate-resistant acid phosphatase type 5